MGRSLFLTILLMMKFGLQERVSSAQSAARVNTNQAQYDNTYPFYGILGVNPADPNQPPIIHNYPLSRLVDTLKTYLMPWEDTVTAGPVMTEFRAEQAISGIEAEIAGKQAFTDTTTWDATIYDLNSALSGTTPNTRTITINGNTQDLSANRTWTVGDLLSSGSYANPTWLTSLAWSKITGAPAFITGITTSDVTTALGYTPVTNARTISINGTSQDLTANRTWTNVGIELPAQTGNTGKVLTTDGANPSWTTASAGTVTGVTGTSPISVTPSSPNPVVSIANAKADGSTKGAAAFSASYFGDNSSGIITNTWTRGTGTVSSNAVTINQPRGQITYNAPNLLAAGTVSVTFTNSFITSTSNVQVTVNGLGADLGNAVMVYLKSQTSGSCVINIRNLSLLSLFNSNFAIDYIIQN